MDGDLEPMMVKQHDRHHVVALSVLNNDGQVAAIGIMTLVLFA